MRFLSWFPIVFFSFVTVVLAKDSVQLRPYKRDLQLTGFTRAKAELTVAGELGGRCTKLWVDRGDIVPPSRVVAELDSTFVRLDLAKNQIDQQQAIRQLDLEKKTLSRYTNLLKSNSAAEATFDEASLRADILALSLKSLQNEEIRLKERLERHLLRGPPGWQVIERFIEEGSFIHQGEPVMRLGDFRQLLVPFSLSYQELQLLEQMDSIVLDFPELQAKVVGEIFRVSPDFESKSRKIPVELVIDQPPFSNAVKLRGGLRAQLTIVGKEEKGSFVIPLSALVNRYEAHWLVKADGERKKVILVGLLGTDEKAQQAIVAGKELVSGESFLLFPDETERKEQGQPNG